MNPFAKKPSLQDSKTEVRATLAEMKAVDDTILDKPIPPETIEPMPMPSSESETHEDESYDEVEERAYSKLSRLVDDDFPFDESQLAAIEGMVGERFACLTGAAGTGKTTTTKKLVDTLLESTNIVEVNMKTYWKTDYNPEDEYDDYESKDDFIPAVVMCAYTGRATQMIKKNFPRDWHGNIMTIHRLLGFYPEFDQVFDAESGNYRKTVKFVPTYNSELKLPWDIIIIDEAGMLGLELWHQLLDACKPGCRIYMIGDINQLPPVHGKSIFGFAMAKWPSWELTHVHRQQGKDNPIVDNAWRILRGLMPVSAGRFQMIELKGDASYASRHVQKIAQTLAERSIYDPIRDTIITPINGEEGSRGFQLGQLPLNRSFALMFNRDHDRYIIDGGRERKQFAVGDKVMATRNDWEAGITNGMTGIIESIEENPGYSGDRNIFGTIQEVNEYLRSEGDKHVDFSLEELDESYMAQEEAAKDKKEKRERGPSSHIVTVRFGSAEHGFAIAFRTLAEVGSLMTAYVVTCHKMQGGESPVIIVILHDANKAMLYREWLYTAVTRASEKCILLYTPTALRATLSKQSIKGSTLQDKVRSFNQAMDPKGLLGCAIRVELPEPSGSGATTVLERKAIQIAAPRMPMTDAERNGGLASILKKARERVDEIPPERVTHVHVTINVEASHAKESVSESVRPDIDGGELSGIRVPVDSASTNVFRPRIPSGVLRIADHSQPIPQWGAYRVLQQIESDRSCLRLTHQPQPTEERKVNPWAKKLNLGK